MVWIVIYKVDKGGVFGWVCRASSPSQAEELFWDSTIIAMGRTVMCVARLPIDTRDRLLNSMDSILAIYEEKHDDE
jgi:hypothetical protein